MASCAANGARRFLRARSIDRLTAAVTSNASFDSAAWARSYCSTLINASWTSSSASAADTPRRLTARLALDRKSVSSGKRVSVRVDLYGTRDLKKKINKALHHITI